MYEEKVRYLSRYAMLEKEIDRLVNEINRWRDLAVHITPSYSGMPHATQKSDKLQSAAENILEAEGFLAEKILALRKERHNIEECIASVGDLTLEAILKRHYIDGKSLEDVAEDLGYSHRWIRKLHQKALAKIKIGKSSSL